MGRGGSGVEVREASIRLGFTVDGKFYRRTLMLNGAAMLPTPANVRYAHRLIIEIRDRIRNGSFSMAEYFPASGSGLPTTVGDQLETWLSAQRIEHSTRAAYESAAKFWRSSIGDKPLRSLKHSEILSTIAARGDLSGKTINNYVSVLREALALAARDKLIQTNPAHGIERAKWQRDPPDPFTRDEAEAIIADIAKHHTGPIHNLVEWRIFTGVRTSEAAGLRWANVDLVAGSMVVREALVRGQEKANTKTNVARTVLLNPRAIESALRAEYERGRRRSERIPMASLALNVRHENCHKAADAFWTYWNENGETHKRGYYESTWGAINCALRTVGVAEHDYGERAHGIGDE